MEIIKPKHPEIVIVSDWGDNMERLSFVNQKDLEEINLKNVLAKGSDFDLGNFLYEKLGGYKIGVFDPSEDPWKQKKSVHYGGTYDCFKDGLLEKLKEEKEKLYEHVEVEIIDHKLSQDAYEVLEQIKGEIPFYAFSNGPQSMLDDLGVKCGLQRFIGADHIISASENYGNKKSVEGFMQGLDHMKIDPKKSKVIFPSDTLEEVIVANDAGLVGIWHKPQEAKSEKGIEIIENYQQVLNYIK